MVNWQQQDQTYLLSTYSRYPIAIAKAEGSYLTDTKGNQYLDLFTGLAVNILGHAHPKLLAAAQEQLDQFLHISNYFLNPPAIRLAKQLVEQTLAGGKVFYTNSGAEATEAAIKLIHKWTQDQQNEKTGVVVLKNGFHGRTLGAVRLTRQPSVYQDFPTLTLPVYEVTANEPAELIAICEKHRPAAILVEPILGAGGIQRLTPAYLKEIASLCKAYQMLFCMDEIQTGLGRTGKLFAYQHHPLSPDLILFAKGIGGGLPLGGIIVAKPHTHLFEPGDHGTTFAPSPLSAAMGSAVLKVLLADGLLEESKKTAEYLWRRLRKIIADHPDLFRSIDGQGMMIGIQTHLTANQAKQIQTELQSMGILIDVTAQTIFRLLPPLTLTIDEVDRFIAQFEMVIRDL